LTADLLRKESLESDAAALILEAREKWPEFRGVAFRAGTVAANKGDHAQAAALFREELKRYPGDPASWQALGEALVSLGRPVEASEALKRAIWLDAGATASYILLARVYVDAGRFAVAEDTLNQALKTAPQSYEANFLLSRLYHQTGRIELALTQDNGFSPAKMDEWMTFTQPFNDLPPDINDKWRSHVDVSGLHVAQQALGLDTNPALDLSSGESLLSNL
jgi:tetratricopeptide (TPR) repeat protein